MVRAGRAAFFGFQFPKEHHRNVQNFYRHFIWLNLQQSTETVVGSWAPQCTAQCVYHTANTTRRIQHTSLKHTAMYFHCISASATRQSAKKTFSIQKSAAKKAAFELCVRSFWSRAHIAQSAAETHHRSRALRLGPSHSALRLRKLGTEALAPKLRTESPH